MRQSIRFHYVFILIGLCLFLKAPASADENKVGQSANTWPPAMGQPFPDIAVIDHNGQVSSLSKLRGKPVLIELIGMTCKGCNAFSGGHTKGQFGNIQPQPGLKSLAEYFPLYTKGLNLNDNRFHFVQVLLYDLGLEQPDVEDVKRWANHFGFNQQSNAWVVSPKDDLRSAETRSKIPGFYLLDSEMRVVSDATGRMQSDVWTKTLPMLAKMLN